MATIGNVPQERLVLRAAARKSWALGLIFRTELGAPIDVTDAVITLDIATVSPGGVITPVLHAEAEPVTPMTGHVRFLIQADDTDLPTGEYATTLTMRTGGYSSVVADGETEILPNTETASVGFTYEETEDNSQLEIWLKRRNVIKIVAPNVQTKGNQGDIGLTGPAGPAGPGLPAGGAIQSIPTKTSLADYVTAWVSRESLFPTPSSTLNVYVEGDHTIVEFVPIDDIGLDATGTDVGMVPRSVGSDMWGWDKLLASDIVDTDDLVVMTIEERDKLASIDGGSLASSDWAAEVDEPGFIHNKPELGTASAAAVEDFRASDWVPSLFDLSDVDGGNELPETGPPGTFWVLLPTPPGP